MTPPPVRIPFSKVESLVASGNSGLTASELRMFVGKGILRPGTAQVALDNLEFSGSNENTKQQATSTHFNPCTPPNPLSSRLSSSSAPSSSSGGIVRRHIPPRSTSGTTWYSSFSQSTPQSMISSPSIDRRTLYSGTTKVASDTMHQPTDTPTTLCARSSCSAAWPKASEASTGSNSGKIPGDQSSPSFSDQNSLDSEYDLQSDVIGDSRSSSSGESLSSTIFPQNSAHDLTSPSPSLTPLVADAVLLQKSSKRKNHATVKSASNATEQLGQSPGVRFRTPFGTPIPNRSKLPAIAESNEEDISILASTGSSSQAVNSTESPSLGTLGDFGLGSEACSPGSRLRTREVDTDIISTRVSKSINAIHLKLPRSLTSQRLQLAREHFANSGTVQVLPPQSTSLVVPYGGAHVLEYPLLLPEILQASKERTWMADDWDIRHPEGQVMSRHSNKRVRVGNNSQQVISSSKYIPEANSRYLSHHSGYLGSGSLRSDKEGHPERPADVASVQTLAKLGSSHKHSLTFILNSDGPANRKRSLTLENEMGLGEGAGSSTRPHVPTERERKGAGSSSGVRKHSQKMPSFKKSIMVPPTASVAKKVVKHSLGTKMTKPGSSAKTAEAFNKKSTPTKPEAGPVMVYFKLKPNGSWFVRNEDSLIDPPPQCRGSNDSGIKSSSDGKKKKSEPMCTEGSTSLSSASLPEVLSQKEGRKNTIPLDVYELSANTSASPASTSSSYHTKARHSDSKVSKMDGPPGASTSTTLGFASIFASGKKQKAGSDVDKLRISVTTASTFAASSGISGKMKKVIRGDGDMPSSVSTLSTSSSSSQRAKARRRASLAPADSSSSSSFRFVTSDGSSKQSKAAPSVERPAAHAAQASFSSSSQSPKATYNILVRSSAFSPGSIYRPLPSLRQGDSDSVGTTTHRVCGSCERKEEKFWRYGLKETSFLCSACGLRFRKTLVHCADVEHCAYIPTLSELERMEREKTRMKWESVRCLNCRGPVVIYKRD